LPQLLPLSVNLMPHAPVSAIVELAVLAESVGCTRCWVYDEGLSTRDVYVTLAAIASATSTIGIGTGITNPYVRHPGATATAIATLDELSGGRAFLGLGAGGALTLDPLAIERTRPVSTVRDTIESLRSLWRGDTVDLDGEVFSFRNARLPYARPDINIIVAGRGPKMMQLASTHADGFYLSYVHKSTIGSAVTRVRPKDRPFSVVYSTAIAITDAEIEAVRAQLTFRLVDSPPDVRDLIGCTDAVVAKIRTALAEGGPPLAARHVEPEWVAHFAITGQPNECAQELDGIMTADSIDEFQLAVSDIQRGGELIERTAALFRGN
jgi:5,10-methylenetetrahydromethanopterin reductase